MSKHFCMLAHKYDPKRVEKWPVAVEPKLDGVRVLAFVGFDSGTSFVSRNNKPFPALDHLREPLTKLCAHTFGRDAGGVVLECEALSGTFAATVSSVRRKSVMAKDAVLHVFDVLWDIEFFGNVPSCLYSWRRDRALLLRGAAPWLSVVPFTYAHSHEQVLDIYTDYREQGYEGVMVKSLSGLYERKRSHAWMKMKAEESVDVPVIGRFAGEGKHAGRLGGLIVKHGGVEVRVGTGFTDTQREELWECKFAQLRNRLVEVQYHEETPDGSLRHPRFVRFRDALTGAKE